MTMEERFWAKVEKTDGCWTWTGSTFDAHGTGITRYGSFWVTSEKAKRAAHRVSWLLAHGSWPEVVDHLCRNTLCVRPDHLRSVDHAENIRVGNSPSAVAVRTGVCQRGHDNWAVIKSTGKRRCMTCVRDKERERRAKARLIA